MPRNPSVTDALSTSEGQVESPETEIQVLQKVFDRFVSNSATRLDRGEASRFPEDPGIECGSVGSHLRKALGCIRLEVVVPEAGHPYYVAHAKLDIMELLDSRTGNFRADRNDPRPPADRQGVRMHYVCGGGGN
jgi:hypothetical protein